MPELPEVEVTRRRLESELLGKKILRVEIRTPKLRLPIPVELARLLPGRTILSVGRRGKYLLFDCETGWLIVHLGMTGFLRVLFGPVPPEKHDHFDVVLTDGVLLRFHDPRKFGTVIWTKNSPETHPLLSKIGPEPFSETFNGEYLFTLSRLRKVAVKQLLMNSAVVAGVGNIYANESLFRSGIRPDRPASSLTVSECDRLVVTIIEVLQESIKQGSTYKVAEETLVYYPQEFLVYGRGNRECTSCRATLAELRLGNRSSVFCPRCQV